MKVIAYHVTARRAADARGFRRLGRWFPVGEPVRVPRAALSPPQVEFLVGSDPRDLIVVAEYDAVRGTVTVEPDRAQLEAAVSAFGADGGPIIITPAPAKKGRGK